ncbi:hypothetical protein [Achromobacter marplatensis]|uniref:hypothetical protein n=1 Tax=Achromobacter marplatensis TaxID=470868 RepID=UPI003C752353
MPSASQTVNAPARPACSEADLNFAPQFRPFYAQEIAGYERELDKLVLPGEFRALTEQPRLQLQACRLRAGGLVVSLESTPISVHHRAEHAADLDHAEFLASFVIAGMASSFKTKRPCRWSRGTSSFARPHCPPRSGCTPIRASWW